MAGRFECVLVSGARVLPLTSGAPITNAAAAGTPPAALMARAGHSSFTTTQGYIDLAGETFREEADRLERRLWGETSTKTGTKSPIRRPRRQRTR